MLVLRLTTDECDRGYYVDERQSFDPIVSMLLSSSRSVSETASRAFPIRNEIVMMPGMQILASNDIGTIRICAGAGYERAYEWEGFRRSVVMEPRNQRWNGSLGLYYPGPGYHWSDAGGIRRVVAEEGWQHFNDLEEAQQWIAELNRSYNFYNGQSQLPGTRRLLTPMMRLETAATWSIPMVGA